MSAELRRTMQERDAAQEWADRLAYAVGGQDIGEHSNWNNPWANALELAEKMRVERDAAIRRASDLTEAIGNYIVTVTRAAHRPDHPNYRTPEQVEAAYLALLNAVQSPALRSQESQKPPETAR